MTKDDKIGIAIIVVVVCAFAALIGLRIYVEQAGAEYDEETLCLRNKPVDAHTIILIDRTDAVTEAQSSALRELILSYKARLKQFELLSLLAINEDLAGPALIFASCNPGDGDNANPWYQNPRRVQQQYENKFGEPLNRVIASLMDAKTAPQSPIIETINSIANADNFSNRLGERRLIIFSDFLQNSSGYTHYDRKTSVADLELEYVRERIPELTGASVALSYVERPAFGNLQDDEHAAFWRAFFERAGVRIPGIPMVPATDPKVTSGGRPVQKSETTHRSPQAVPEISPAPRVAVYSGLEFVGADLGAISAPSASACAAHCVSTGQNCRAYTFRPKIQKGLNNCFLKSGTGSPGSQADVVSGLIIREEKPRAITATETNMYQGTYFTGPNLDPAPHTRDGTAQDCRAACLRSSSCKGFTFVSRSVFPLFSGKRGCWLKSHLMGRQPLADAISGEKRLVSFTPKLIEVEGKQGMNSVRGPP